MSLINNIVYEDYYYPYPLTICFDRYSGTYSGGEFTAWHLDANEVPEEIYSDDVTCSLFWDKNEIPVGKGYTPEEAIKNLIYILKEEKKNERH